MEPATITRRSRTDGADETVETTAWVVVAPLPVAATAAGGSIWVARLNREAGLALAQERRVTALALERETHRIAQMVVPAPR